MMQIRLLDHIIVGSGHYSFADHGLMANAQRWCEQVMSQASGNGSVSE
jgi:hypothetical protein